MMGVGAIIMSTDPAQLYKTTWPPLRIGTRGSPLALFQARSFASLVERCCPLLRDVVAFEERIVSTSGDRIQNRRIADVGGKGLFAKEIHEALLDRKIDFAVHSLKDLETQLPSGIVLGCVLRRGDPRDALVTGAGCGPIDPAAPWAALPHGAVVGTASLRRQAQLLHRRPDLDVRLIRGNVETRLALVTEGRFDATLLAMAGLRRLGLVGEHIVPLEPEVVVPAAGQGIIGITVRANDLELRDLLRTLDDCEARVAAIAERALLAELAGSCRTPIGSHARLLPGGRVELTGLVARPDGSFLTKQGMQGPASQAARLGAELGHRLREACPIDILG
jgi:hydroxymethylbilane synthase